MSDLDPCLCPRSEGYKTVPVEVAHRFLDVSSRDCSAVWLDSVVHIEADEHEIGLASLLVKLR